MQYFDVLNLDFNQIKIFICVAESGSFSAAARKLNYSQSMVSKTISALEHNLDLQLVLRVKSQNILTEAGNSLYKDFKRLLNDTMDSIKRAHEAQRISDSTLHIGVIDCVTSRENLAYMILRICNQNHIFLQYNEQGIKELVQQAQAQKLDVIITSAIDQDTLMKCGYHTKVFYHTKAAVFLPKSNPLCEREVIHLSDLANEKFIMLSPENSPNYLRYFYESCKKAGFVPNVLANVANTHSYKVNILNGQGIVFADDHTDIIHKDIKKYVLDDVPSDIIIAWLDDVRNSNENFVNELVKFYHEGME